MIDNCPGMETYLRQNENITIDRIFENALCKKFNEQEQMLSEVKKLSVSRLRCKTLAVI